MDLHVSLWDVNSGIVCTRYFGSEFMVHGTAEDMWKKINDSISRLNLAKLVQISMDGPNVNWKLFETMQGDLKQNFQLTLLNTVCQYDLESNIKRWFSLFCLN